MIEGIANDSLVPIGRFLKFLQGRTHGFRTHVTPVRLARSYQRCIYIGHSRNVNVGDGVGNVSGCGVILNLDFRRKTGRSYLASIFRRYAWYN